MSYKIEVARKAGDGVAATNAGASVRLKNVDHTLMTFGGEGRLKNGGSTTSNPPLSNTVMEYGIGSDKWTHRGGKTSTENNGVYGTLGEYAAGNNPGGRERAQAFTSNDRLYLFGGWGFAENTLNVSNQHLNDMWQLDPVTRQWRWIGGSKVENQSGVYGTLGVFAAANIPGARRTAFTWVDSTGKCFMFGGFGVDEVGNAGALSDLWCFDPDLGDYGQWAWIAGPKLVNQTAVFETIQTPTVTQHPGGVYASNAAWVDSNDALYLQGGFGYDSTNAQGYLSATWRYHQNGPNAGQWEWVAGSNLANQAGVYGTQGVPDAANFPGGRIRGVACAQGDTAYLFFGRGYDSASAFGLLNDVFVFDCTTLEYTWVNGADTVNALPNGHLDPNVLDPSYTPGAREAGAIYGVDLTYQLINIVGGSGFDSNGDQGKLVDHWVFDIATSQWRYSLNPHIANQVGTAVRINDASATSHPGARYYAAYWYSTTNFQRQREWWIFGGLGRYSSTDPQDRELADLWLYVSDFYDNWGWMGGQGYAVATSVYGTINVPSVNNSPGARKGAMTAQFGDYVYMFGGYGCINTLGDGSLIEYGYLNEVWRYRISTKEWTFLGGDQNTLNAEGVYGTITVEDAGNKFPSRAYGGAWLTPDESAIILFGGYGYGGPAAALGKYSDTWKFNLSNNRFTWMHGTDQPEQQAVITAILTFDPSFVPASRYKFATFNAQNYCWLLGGYSLTASGDGQMRDIWAYDPVSNQWKRDSWWSSKNQPQSNSPPHVYDVNTLIGSAEGQSAVYDDSRKLLWVFGGYGYDTASTLGYLNGLYSIKFDPVDPEYLYGAFETGSVSADFGGRYNTEDVERFDNYMGGRENTAMWIDNNNNLFFFGGFGKDADHNYNCLQDLWTYRPENDQQVWLDGANEATNAMGVFGTTDEYSDDVVPGPMNYPSAFAFTTPIVAGDSVSVDGTDFEIDVDFQSGSSPAEAAANLAAAINDAALPGVQAEIDPLDDTKILLSDPTAGTDGNAHTLAKVDGGRENFVLSGSTFSGGTEGNLAQDFSLKIDDAEEITGWVAGVKVFSLKWNEVDLTNKVTFANALRRFLKHAGA